MIIQISFKLKNVKLIINIFWPDFSQTLPSGNNLVLQQEF